MTYASSRSPRVRPLAAILAVAALALAMALALREAGDWLRLRLETALQERLVPQLRIARPLDIDLWPALSVSVRGITLSEGPDATALAVDSITLRPDIPRLAQGEISLDALEVSGVALTLRREAQGWNVERWLRETEGAGAGQVPAIGRVTVEGATIALEGEVAGELADLTLVAGPLAPDAAGSLRANGRLAMRRPASAALRFAFEAAYRIEGARIMGNDAKLTVEGELAGWRLEDAALRADALVLGNPFRPHLKGTSLSLDAARDEAAVEIQAALAELVGTGSGWQGADLSLAAHIRQAQGALTGTLTAPKLEAEGPEWRVPGLTAHLASGDGLPPFALDLTASASAPSGGGPIALDIVHARARLPHPTGRPDPLALGFSGTVALDAAQRTAAGTLAGRFDASRFEADWRLDPASAPPVHVKVALDRLDLDRYLPPPEKGADRADPAAWRNWPVAAELEIGRLRYRDIVSERARLRLSGGLTDGR